MPTCVNAPAVRYKGTEPSPKGLGFCARAEAVGTVLDGNDGRRWIVAATKKKSKRWTPVKLDRPKRAQIPKNLRLKLDPINMRLIIGYYKFKDKYRKLPGDARPYATKASLAKFARANKMWNVLNTDIDAAPVSDYDGYVYHQQLTPIKPSHIARVKVLSAPIHDSTIWEKMSGKHAGWKYKPDLVLVVDLKQVPAMQVPEQEGRSWLASSFKGMKQLDEKYWENLIHAINHAQNSAEGWINHTLTINRKGMHERPESDPFKGQLRLVQMGPIKTTMPDYRAFA
jgi:hypothetical protein